MKIVFETTNREYSLLPIFVLQRYKLFSLFINIRYHILYTEDEFCFLGYGKYC